MNQFLNSYRNIKALFEDKSIEGRNKLQKSNLVHPFTCGNDRMDSPHSEYQKLHPDEDFGQLIATEEGWICPVCDYKQIYRD